MAEFSTGVTTLLARMDTNPSEFFDGAYKWSFFTAEWVKDILTDDEKTAISNKLTEVRRIAFDQMVMQTLLDSEAERESRLGLGNKAKMALQGSSLVTPMTTFEQQLQQRMQNQYANAALNAAQSQYANAAQSMYPNGTGTATSRFSSK
jgi:hypothetical protein